MCLSSLLHPTQVNDIIYMTELVDVIRADYNFYFERIFEENNIIIFFAESRVHSREKVSASNTHCAAAFNIHRLDPHSGIFLKGRLHFFCFSNKELISASPAYRNTSSFLFPVTSRVFYQHHLITQYAPENNPADPKNPGYSIIVNK